MKLAALVLAFVATAASAADPIRLTCTRESDTFAGVVQYNPEVRVITIDTANWNVTDTNGILQAGSLSVAGPYVRLNRFNGVVMARWRPTTPAGALDMAAICDVVQRKF